MALALFPLAFSYTIITTLLMTLVYLCFKPNPDL
jgi:hypothetical protein